MFQWLTISYAGLKALTAEDILRDIDGAILKKIKKSIEVITGTVV
jgi:hypothetical protein